MNDGFYLTPASREGDMARIVVIGGGICGLGGALLLARDGHEVTVLERDDQAAPGAAGDAWGGWDRRGVAQFRQPHNFMPGMRRLMEAELPDVQASLVQAGATRFEFLNPMPPPFAGTTNAVDETLWAWTARRPVGEWVFLQAAERERGVTVRRGVWVNGLVTGPGLRPGTPHVTGVRTHDGETIAADLVVDATGRGSRALEWLAAIGAAPPYEQAADIKFTYHTRYFHGPIPPRFGPPLFDYDTISILTLPGDNDTWSVTIFCSSEDRELRGLRQEEAWMRVVRAHPMQAHWLDGEPISDVLTMTGVVDRYRRFRAGDAPVVTGFVAVADAWACTNPSAGRGMTVGMEHALRLRDALRRAGEDGWALTALFDEATERDITPWYEAQQAADRARFAQIDALRLGREPPPPADPLTRDLQALRTSMMADPELFRFFLQYVAALTPVQQIMARPGVRERVYATAAEVAKAAPPAFPGPTRPQLEDLAAV
jgi:2-polyprenyl-6-methoxyphenol hydroxylase-like FAD-dependent oxidoreductase